MTTAVAIALPVGRDGTEGDNLSRLGAILLSRGLIDHRSLERARRVAGETNGRLDRVLTQLGMVSERSLADAFAELVDAPVAQPADYPEGPLISASREP